VCISKRGFIHVDACLSAIPLHEQQCIPCENKYQYILAARCCYLVSRLMYRVKIRVSSEQVLGSGCALLCEVLED